MSRLPTIEAHHLAEIFLSFVMVLSISISSSIVLFIAYVTSFVSFISTLVVMAMVTVATSTTVMIPMLVMI